MRHKIILNYIICGKNMPIYNFGFHLIINSEVKFFTNITVLGEGL